jgi:hypothetical protein
LELVSQYLKEQGFRTLTDRKAYCKELLKNYYANSFLSSTELEQMETQFDILYKELNNISNSNRKNYNPVSRLEDLINTLEIKLTSIKSN